jgi:hypothetical protein
MGKRGPKAKGDFSSKGATLSARITISTHERLKSLAKTSGASVSQEVEARLLRSFQDDADGAYRDFGFNTEYWLLRLIAESIKETEGFTGRLWRDDAFTFQVMVAAMNSFLKAFRPPGKPVTPNTIAPFREVPPMPKNADAKVVKGYKQREQFMNAIDPGAWGEMIATSILEKIEKLGSTGGDAERAVYQQASVYLKDLLTEDHHGFKITRTTRPRRRRIS